MRVKDYYKILAVSENAAPEEIKKAYRQLAKKYHPDANPGDKAAEERFKEINDAYDVLGDPNKRKKYDQLRFFGNASGNSEWFSLDPEILHQHGWPSGGYQTPFGQVFGHGFAFSDILRELFGFQGVATESALFHTPRDVNGEITITFLEAVTGTERTVAVRQKKVCQNCSGSGQERFFRCSRCQGTGAVTVRKKIRLRLPAGIDEGYQLRIPGMGSSSRYREPGDLVITLHVEPHPFFKRQGKDIYFDVNLSDEALRKGARVRVPTISGKKVELTLPAGTRRGALLRLKNLGISVNGQPGDQFVRIV
jgi:DnaJ-class molecular chaperone